MSPGEGQYAVDDPLVGRVLSERYRVLELIGEGGIGRVYLAEHLTTGREVALKVLLPEFAGNLQLVDTFLEEARTVSRLGHENIIDIYYGGRSSEGYAFLVMEHLKGLDLADTLNETGPMSWDRARQVLLQIASALATCSRMGRVRSQGIGPVSDRVSARSIPCRSSMTRKAMPSEERPP